MKISTWCGLILSLGGTTAMLAACGNGSQPSAAPAQMNAAISGEGAIALVVAPLMGRWYLQNAQPAANLRITVTGRMWYWTYKYSNYANLSFSAPMFLPSAGEKVSDPGWQRTHDHIVVPVGKTVRIIAVSANVIYSWYVSPLGITIQAVPGWSNQSWFRAAKEGRYYGQCSELCGLPHTFKPVEIEVVSQARFDTWVAEASGKLALAGAPQLQRQESTRPAVTDRERQNLR